MNTRPHWVAINTSSTSIFFSSCENKTAGCSIFLYSHTVLLIRSLKIYAYTYIHFGQWKSRKGDFLCYFSRCRSAVVYIRIHFKKKEKRSWIAKRYGCIKWLLKWLVVPRRYISWGPPLDGLLFLTPDKKAEKRSVTIQSKQWSGVYSLNRPKAFATILMAFLKK